MKNVCDQLLSVGVNIPEEDIIIVILNGLLEEYAIVRTVIEGRETPISLCDLRSQPFAANRHIECSFSLHSTMSAMVARGNGTKNEARNGDNGGWISRLDDKGKGAKQSNGSVKCQACGKWGHIVDTCFRVHKCQICGKQGRNQDWTMGWAKSNGCFGRRANFFFPPKPYI